MLLLAFQPMLGTTEASLYYIASSHKRCKIRGFVLSIDSINREKFYEKIKYYYMCGIQGKLLTLVRCMYSRIRTWQCENLKCFNRTYYWYSKVESKFNCMIRSRVEQSNWVAKFILNKRHMGHIAHLRKQFKSINTYDYIITLIKRRIKTLLTLWEFIGSSFEQIWIPFTQGCFVPSLV